MDTLLHEPAFWAITTMIAVTASQAIGAFWARSDFEKLERYVTTVFSREDEFTQAELELARMMMRNAVSWYSRPVMFIVVPFMAIYLIGRVLFLAISGKELTPESVLGRTAKSQGDWMNTINGAIWKSFPLLLVWLALWFAAPILLIIGLYGSSRVGRQIVERLSVAVLGHGLR